MNINPVIYYIMAIATPIIFIIIFMYPYINAPDKDKYGQYLDQQGNFIAFGEKWFCSKTGVNMDCYLVGKSP